MVEKFVFQLEAQLADRRVHHRGTNGLAEVWLGETGYDPMYGARPLTRVIEEHIKRPLRTNCCSAGSSNGGTVRAPVTGQR